MLARDRGGASRRRPTALFALALALAWSTVAWSTLASCSLVVPLDALQDGAGAAGGGAGGGPSTSSSPAVGGGGAGCPGGKAECDGNPATACETNVTGDVRHCGACGNACAEGASGFPVCKEGVCGIGCDAGSGDCDGLLENGCETPTAANDKHCGACGRDCQGGACQAGLCAPVLLAEDEAPYRLAVNSTRVFWTAGETVKSVKKIGGFIDTIYGGDPSTIKDNPWGVAADESHVYWTDRGTGIVYQAKLDGSERVAFASGQAGPAGIALDESHVYWVNFVQTAEGGVYRKAKAGGAVERVAADPGSPSALALDESHVYWVATDAGEVARAKKAAGAKREIVASGHPNAWAIAAHAGQVYFTEDDNEFGRVLGIPAAGGEIQVIAENQRFPFSVAADDSGVYWTAAFDDKVLRAPLEGGESTVLARDLDTPEGLALDDKTVYFGELLGNAVKKVAK